MKKNEEWNGLKGSGRGLISGEEKRQENWRRKTKSLNATTHGQCAQVELLFEPTLASSSHKKFKIPVKK